MRLIDILIVTICAMLGFGIMRNILGSARVEPRDDAKGDPDRE